MINIESGNVIASKIQSPEIQMVVQNHRELQMSLKLLTLALSKKYFESKSVYKQ